MPAQLPFKSTYSGPFFEPMSNITICQDITVKKTGDKYQSNIVIFTDEYDKRVFEKIKPVYENYAEKVHIKGVYQAVFSAAVPVESV